MNALQKIQVTSDIVSAVVGVPMRLVDEYKLARRVVFALVAFMLLYTTMNMAPLLQLIATLPDPTGASLVIGAILTPLSGLAGWVFKTYFGGRVQEQEMSREDFLEKE